MKQVKYIKGIKYQLRDDLVTKTGIIGYDIDIKFIKLTLVGILTLRHGYVSDGPSGPTIDTKDFMRGAFVHDGLYELIRRELLPIAERSAADKLLKDICIEDGMY
jgi:hypothetical protein